MDDDVVCEGTNSSGTRLNGSASLELFHILPVHPRPPSPETSYPLASRDASCRPYHFTIHDIQSGWAVVALAVSFYQFGGV